MQIVSDLACELLRKRPPKKHGITIENTQHAGITIQTTHITTNTAAHEIGKPLGTYVNIDATNARSKRIITALYNALWPLIADRRKILVVGLGNNKFIADSLGPQVLPQLHTNDKLVTFEPNVCGVTGINSVDAIKAICNLVRPTIVMVIDSLVSAAPQRIGNNYQICDSGITPGSGLNRDNQTINQKLLGVPVLAVGIPVCTIMTTPHHLYHVVPKDIELVIHDCAQIIAGAINILASKN